MSADHIELSKTRISKEAGEEVTLETEDSSFARAVNHGVNDDSMDYGKLYFWSGLGTFAVIVFVVALMFFAQFSFLSAQRNASASSTYLEITKLKADQNEQLNSFGVVDLEDGVYHIPIDEAINKVAVD
ncbi:MAG: hypothetical protein JJ971_07570 [Balneolaceae bacterium]|nr:hypothetical protein [Balneolaceae bacterium]MBO6546907.1 hypothetical protein [Balneolaceae bacterium]MBO6649267.1 hypothetical protein [Balneolaceae bacterium]